MKKPETFEDKVTYWVGFGTWVICVIVSTFIVRKLVYYEGPDKVVSVVLLWGIVVFLMSKKGFVR